MNIIPSVKVRGGLLVYNRVHIHNFQTLYDSVVLVSSAYVQYAIDITIFKIICPINSSLHTGLVTMVIVWLMKSNTLFQVDHVRKSELEKKRKYLRTKYCEMAKNLQKDNWMYSSVDDILQGKTK